MTRAVVRSQIGFSLIELMILLSLLMVILSFGIPSLASYIKNSRVSSYTNALLNDINFARSEAVTRGHTVILCRSANAESEHPSCGGTAHSWTSGWIVFVDLNSNATFDQGVDILLNTTHDFIGSITVKSNKVSDTNLIYKADGTIDMGGATAVFAICDDRGEGYGNQLQISPTGKPHLITPIPSTCNSPTI